MIVFVTGYDSATNDNYKVLCLLEGDGKVKIYRIHAVESRLIAELTKSVVGKPTPLFLASHGKRNAVIGNDNNDALSAHNGHLSYLAGRVVFALACWTACELGQLAAKNGAIWMGYGVKVSAIPGASISREDFANYFETLMKMFPLVSCSATANKFFGDLSEMNELFKKRMRKKHGKLKISWGICVDEWLNHLEICLPNGMICTAPSAPPRLESVL